MPCRTSTSGTRADDRCHARLAGTARCRGGRGPGRYRGARRASPRRPIAGRVGPGGRRAARPRRAGHRLGQVRGVLDGRPGPARRGVRPHARGLATAGPHAQPGGRRRALRAQGGHPQLVQLRRLGRHPGRPGRGPPRRPAHQPRAARQPPVRRRGPAVAAPPPGHARHRRGALHLELGSRLPTRLPTHRRPPDRPPGPAGAGDHGHRQRPGHRRRGRPARTRPPRPAGHAGPHVPAPVGGAPARDSSRPMRGSTSTCPSSPARASSTPPPCGRPPTWARTSSAGATTSAPTTDSSRPRPARRIEEELRDNRIKAVVATSALGMGYDKPDLGFVVHVGSPGSPVDYYQQVGRAGRALDTAQVVLIPTPADEGIWHYFAHASIPRVDDAEAVLTALARSGDAMTVPRLAATTGVRDNRLELLVKVLAVEGAVRRTEAGWESTGEAWAYDERALCRPARRPRARVRPHARLCALQPLPRWRAARGPRRPGV